MKRTSLNAYDCYPKNKMAQSVLYHNMSHHYRRLYNAKPSVDTSTPKSYKLLLDRQKLAKNRASHKYTPDLILQGNNVFKKDPASAKDNGQKYHECQKFGELDNRELLFCPKILKTNVQSKLLNSRDYHPPRKKISTKDYGFIEKQVVDVSAQQFPVVSENNEEYKDDFDDDVDWLQIPSQENLASRSSSNPSSSDSAYTEEGEVLWSGAESREISPQQVNPKNWPSSPENYNITDRRYVIFLRTLTDEILRKGVYTNKALKKIFLEHMFKNRGSLDMERMQKAVGKLQEDLGIPKDDDLDEQDYGLGGVSIDSEFGFPRTKSDIWLDSNNDLVESIENLKLNTSINNDNINRDWFHPETRSNSHCSSDMKISLKLPFKDNDNDSSIGCEILSGTSSEIDVESCYEKNIEDR